MVHKDVDVTKRAEHLLHRRTSGFFLRHVRLGDQRTSPHRRDLAHDLVCIGHWAAIRDRDIPYRRSMTTFPCWITSAGAASTLRSESGSPRTASKSAAHPAAIVPVVPAS